MKFIFTIVILLSAVIIPSELSANVVYSLYYNGLGVSAEGTYNASGEAGSKTGGNPKNDASLALSYRAGYFFLISGFLALDAGYQFREKSWNQKAGIQLMFIYFGAETGYCLKTKNVSGDGRKYYSGGYVGGIFSHPFSDRQIISVSSGGNLYYKKSENEFYIRATTIYNFATN